jgi:hypothetical protein
LAPLTSHTTQFVILIIVAIATPIIPNTVTIATALNLRGPRVVRAMKVSLILTSVLVLPFSLWIVFIAFNEFVFMHASDAEAGLWVIIVLVFASAELLVWGIVFNIRLRAILRQIS